MWRNISSKGDSPNHESSGERNWLKVLQENSWELELIVSGGAIYTLFQIDTFYLSAIRFLHHHELLLHPIFTAAICMIPIKILILGFGLHLASRAFWLALICINHVFPDGIVDEHLDWVGPWEAQQSRSDFEFAKQIVIVDNFCGLVIFNSIILFGQWTAVSLIILLSDVLLIPIWALHPVLSKSIWFIWCLATALYVFDTLLGEYVRRGMWPSPYNKESSCENSFRLVMSWIGYYPIRFFDWLTLRRIYAPALTLYYSNHGRGKAISYKIPAILGCVIWSLLSLSDVLDIVGVADILFQFKDWRESL